MDKSLKDYVSEAPEETQEATSQKERSGVTKDDLEEAQLQAIMKYDMMRKKERLVTLSVDRKCHKAWVKREKCHRGLHFPKKRHHGRLPLKKHHRGANPIRKHHRGAIRSKSITSAPPAAKSATGARPGCKKRHRCAPVVSQFFSGEKKIGTQEKNKRCLGKNPKRFSKQ